MEALWKTNYFGAKNFSKREYISKLLIKESEKMGITCKTIREMKSIMKRLRINLPKKLPRQRKLEKKRILGNRKTLND